MVTLTTPILYPLSKASPTLGLHLCMPTLLERGALALVKWEEII